MVCIDVLHALDLGVTQDMLGNLFCESMDTLFKEGRNTGERLNLLWLRLKKWYSLFNPPSQIQKLSEEMVKRDNKGPKLKAKGAETRHMTTTKLKIKKINDKNECK